MTTQRLQRYVLANKEAFGWKGGNSNGKESLKEGKGNGNSY